MFDSIDILKVDNEPFYMVDISSGTLYLVDCESADVRSENCLCSNERYIQKLQNDTNIALEL